eukprot:TRINITY_DN124903_c0_g1_i1.p1 TRINITY_DN124903_c0_g1~~TRINITY_DN124903_c0_g1_i1.p1  ORF type:complete len:144 (+),score=3.31 TRINITY_DN124903_c0_g1_i1:70-501(+)
MSMSVSLLGVAYTAFSCFAIFRWTTTLLSEKLRSQQQKNPSAVFWPIAKGFLYAFVALHTQFLFVYYTGGSPSLHLLAYDVAIIGFEVFGTLCLLAQQLPSSNSTAGCVGRAMGCFMPSKKFIVVSVINVLDVAGRHALLGRS